MLTREDVKSRFAHILLHRSGVIFCDRCGRSSDAGRWLPADAAQAPTFVDEVISFYEEHGECRPQGVAGAEPCSVIELIFDDGVRRVMRHLDEDEAAVQTLEDEDDSDCF